MVLGRFFLHLLHPAVGYVVVLLALVNTILGGTRYKEKYKESTYLDVAYAMALFWIVVLIAMFGATWNKRVPPAGASKEATESRNTNMVLTKDAEDPAESGVKGAEMIGLEEHDVSGRAVSG